MEQSHRHSDDSLDEDPLLKGFRQNDSRALETLYTSNYRHVERYVKKNSGRSDDAKDVFQDSILAAWINVQAGKFTPKGAGALGGYIFQIAKYKWLDKLKSKSHRSTMRIENQQVADTSPIDLDAIREAEEQCNKLDDCFERLDDKCKLILKGFYYDKKSLEELGQALGHDASTMKTLKYRCMKKLKSLKNKT